MLMQHMMQQTHSHTSIAETSVKPEHIQHTVSHQTNSLGILEDIGIEQETKSSAWLAFAC